MRARLDIPLTVGEVLEATAGFAPGVDKGTLIYAVTTDTRELDEGDLFFALSGANHNGEDYCDVAHKKGALYVSACHKDGILVRSTKDALLALTKLYRRKLTALKKVIAITGSVGKTTTKELTRTILGSVSKTHATEKNYNNYIGLAHTVLSAPKDTEYLIAELGMNHSGEISECSAAISPDVAIITRIGTAHIGNLGSRKMIAKAKLEIGDGMSSSGLLLIPYGEPELPETDERATVALHSEAADFSLLPLASSLEGTAFDFYKKGKKIIGGEAHLFGDGNLKALAFSIACAMACGISADNIKNAFSLISAQNTRQNVFLWNNRLVIDDSYNACLESVLASFDLLRYYPGRRCAVLGDMLELGSMTEELHFRIGAEAVSHGIERLFLIGAYAPFIAKGATLAGMPREHIFLNCDLTLPEATLSDVRENTAENDVILFKASNACRLFSLVQELLSTGDQKNAR